MELNGGYEFLRFQWADNHYMSVRAISTNTWPLVYICLWTLSPGLSTVRAKSYVTNTPWENHVISKCAAALVTSWDTKVHETVLEVLNLGFKL